VLTADDPATAEDEGRSFVFVSGLGGKSIRNQDLDGPWWASIYTSDQDADYGALFGVFHYQGDPRLAYFYFKDISGTIADEFFVESAVALPEPSGVAMLASGIAMLRALRRRRRARHRRPAPRPGSSDRAWVPRSGIAGGARRSRARR
jgi:hypothetical protein